MSDDIEIPDGMKEDRGSTLDEEAKTTAQFVDDLAKTMESVESGDVSKTVAFRDERIAALFHTLKDSPERLQVAVAAARDEVGVEDDSTGDRSELLRLLVRSALVDVTPELADAEKQARLKRIEEDY